MEKLLVICGPTATGKTELAFRLAKKYKAELISADSRQVYKGLDIGTGKDLPKKFKIQSASWRTKSKNGKTGINYYTNGDIRIWGYDLVGPRDEFSVGQYTLVAREIISDIWERGKLPILVGGTGLYIRGVVDGIETANIGRNKDLRKSLEKRSVEELFELLSRLAPIKSASLNQSDRKNPRRLIRAIEIAHWEMENRKQEEQTSLQGQVKFVGLRVSKNILTKRINKRIRKMTKLGIKREIRKLLEQGVTWEHQSMSSLGYREWEGYFRKDYGEEKALALWAKNSIKYTGRQMTWFKADKRIVWFDISSGSYIKDVEKMVAKWYKAR